MPAPTSTEAKLQSRILDCRAFGEKALEAALATSDLGRKTMAEMRAQRLLAAAKSLETAIELADRTALLDREAFLQAFLASTELAMEDYE